MKDGGEPAWSGRALKGDNASTMGTERLSLATSRRAFWYRLTSRAGLTRRWGAECGAGQESRTGLDRI